MHRKDVAPHERLLRPPARQGADTMLAAGGDDVIIVSGTLLEGLQMRRITEAKILCS